MSLHFPPSPWALTLGPPPQVLKLRLLGICFVNLLPGPRGCRLGFFSFRQGSGCQMSPPSPSPGPGSAHLFPARLEHWWGWGRKAVCPPRRA